MKEWKTNFHLNHIQGNPTCENVGYFKVIHCLPFFCLALVPLPYEVNKTGYRHHIYESMNKSSVLHG